VRTVPDALVDDDADGVLGHVEDASSLAVVGLEGHALLERAVALDVNDISALVLAVVGREGFHSPFAERTREHVARTAPDSLRVHHLGLGGLGFSPSTTGLQRCH
jgi:hypothetical protein